MYLVTAKTKATAQDFPGSTVEWAVGQTREVHDSLIQEFKNNPAAWTVSGGATTSTVTATSSDQGVVFTDDIAGQAVRKAQVKPWHKIRTVLLYGDSGVQYANGYTYLAAANLVNDGSGTCVAVIGTHFYLTGTTGYIVNCGDKYWAAKKTITRVNSTTISFPLDPRAAPTLNGTVRPGNYAASLAFVSDQNWTRAGYFHNLNAQLGQPWEYVGNRAANGKTAAEMLLDVDDEVINMDPRPDAVWLQAGANDFRVYGLTVAQSVANAKALVQKFLNAGIAVFWQPWQPGESGDTAGPNWNKAVLQADHTMRQWIESIPGVLYMPRIEAMIDPTSANGYALANTLRAADKIHDSAITGLRCARMAADKYRGLFPSRLELLPNSVCISTLNDTASQRGFFRNPLFLTTSGGTAAPHDLGAAGGAEVVPANVAVIIPSGGGTPTTTGYNGGTNYYNARTVANDGDAIGNNLCVRVTTTAADQQICLDFTCSATGMQVGDIVRALAHVKLKNVSGLRPKFWGMYLQPNLVSTGLQVSSIKAMEDGNSPCPAQFPFDTNEVLATPTFPVPDGTNTFQFRLWFNATGAGVNDIEVGRACMEVRRS